MINISKFLWHSSWTNTKWQWPSLHRALNNTRTN